MSMFGKIRRMYFRDRLSISEIARRTSLSRNTIKKWLASASGDEPKYRRSPVQTKLTPYEPRLRQWLEADSHRPKRDRRTALMLFDALQNQGFTGSYTRVSEFVRRWREAGGGPALSKAFVPLVFEWGEAFQFDWSTEYLVVGGIGRHLQVAHTKLCASRAFLLVAYPAQGQEMLFDAHTRAFRVFGGVPRRGIYDNMKTAVDQVRKGKERIINTRFSVMTAHYLFDPDFCNVASGWEKGQVEKNVQDSRKRLWQEARQAQFGSLDELNAWLENGCRALWQVLAHPDSPALTIAEALETERAHLMPMPTAFDGYVEFVARVSSTCLITADRNQYSVPCQHANQRVSVRQYAGRIEVYSDDVRVAAHDRLFDRGKVRYEWQHYLPLLERKPGALRNGAPFLGLPEPLRSLQAALLKRPGGDRAMVQVLACVPVFGLEAVLVAAELVLESGNTSVEHVRNVLSRLHEPTPAAPLETALQLAEEPVADTSRYDRLYPQESGHV
jgi:transposase